MNKDYGKPFGELYIDGDGEAHFICHTADEDFEQTEIAIKKFIALLQGQIDRREECPYLLKKQA